MLWFCRRSWRLNIDLKKTFVHIWKSYIRTNNFWMCKKQTYVSLCSTEAEIVSLDAGLRMDGIPALDLWDLVIEVFLSSPNQWKKSKGRVQGNLLSDTPSNKHTHHQTKTPIRRTRSLPDLVRRCTFLRITNPWLKWSSMAEVQQWDTYPEPTEFRLIGYLESTWTHKSKSNMSTPNTNSQTYWQRAISHVMSGTIFSIC